MDFTTAYLDYEALTAQLRSWAKEHPALVRLESIGRTEEGRELHLLVIGPDPDRARPTVWVDGNMHAGELCGSNVALQIAHDMLRIHLGESLHQLPPHVLDTLRELRFFIVPRISPDGAEAVLKTGRYVRSVPRDHRPDRQRARWISADIDGDGVALLMRQEDPTGELVESRAVPGLLVPRRIEDPGPYYKLYPEGTIEGFDGANIPSPHFLSDNQTDLNRNFPYSWAHEPDQAGAGMFPGSEPESRAIIEVATKTPSIFAWLNLHTFGGVFIRPLGDKPDSKMDQQDLALFRQLQAWGDELTGYPTVSGFEEFLYEPDKPLRGDLSDYAYHQRGAIAFACELWDLFQQLGFAKKKPFADHYTHMSRDDLEKMGRWDKEQNASRVLRPWKKMRHPQIGEVEVGGVDPRVGIWNPPPEKIAETCTKLSAFMLRVAALAPRMALNVEMLERLSPELTRIDVTVENRGYLSTQILSSAKSLAFNEPVHLSAKPEGGAALVSEGDALRELGHLEGWGRGLYDGTGALYFARTKGSVGRKSARIVVRGHGRVLLRAGSCRVGWIEKMIEI